MLSVVPAEGARLLESCDIKTGEVCVRSVSDPFLRTKWIEP
jgi:hypothetical protein